MLSNQEIFNKVSQHLLSQKQKSRASETDLCRYFGPAGLKCAIGVLFTEEASRFSPAFESISITDIRENNDRPGIITLKNALYCSGVDIYIGSTLELLEELQCVHDLDPIYMWADKLKMIARKYKLETPIEETTP